MTCPCNNPCPNCSDDEPIIPSEILPDDDCVKGGCGCKRGCHDNCGINIQSTNECLTVDTSECGVVKLTSHCPPVVEAGDNVTVDVDEEDGHTVYTVNANNDDELVKVESCGDPGYLDDLVTVGYGLIKDTDCNNLEISFDPSVIPPCPTVEIPQLDVTGKSQWITLEPSGENGHTLVLRDNTTITYDNMVCVGLGQSRYASSTINTQFNMPVALWIDGSIMEVGSWDRFTGNHAMAQGDGIHILEDGYYRVFGQLTVQCNVGDTDFLSLGRGLLRIKGNARTSTSGNEGRIISTAKHGNYCVTHRLTGGTGINVNDSGVISVAGGTVTSPGEYSSVSVVYPQGSGPQTRQGIDGPWFTFNMDGYIDLRKGDVITVGFRGHINDPEGLGKKVEFLFCGQDDASTEYQAAFGGTAMGVQLIAPKLFQEGKGSGEGAELREEI